MQKKLTILFAFAIFLLVLGWAITPAQAHCSGNSTHDNNHRKDPCPDGGVGANDGLYEVTVLGPDVAQGDTSIPFDGKDGAGRAEHVLVSFQQIDLNLSFFKDFFNNDIEGEAGTNCFGFAPALADLGTPMDISREKDGKAFVAYYFRGFGKDGVTEIRYVLRMHGGFSDTDNWRPAMTDEINTVVLTDWEMKTEGKKNKNISCTGTESFGAETIEVKRIN